MNSPRETTVCRFLCGYCVPRLPLPSWIWCSSVCRSLFPRLPLIRAKPYPEQNGRLPLVLFPRLPLRRGRLPLVFSVCHLPVSSVCGFVSNFLIACCFCLILFYVPVCRLCCFPFAASRIPVCRRLPLMLCSRLPLNSVPVCRFSYFSLTRLLTSYTGFRRHAAICVT